MSTFTTPLIVECLDDGRRYRLVEEFDFASDVLERIVRCPVGTVTDFASVPRLLWAILPPTGRWSKASVVHDVLYQYPGCLTPAVTRIQADRTLREGMAVLGTGWLAGWAIYAGVRLGGWVAWAAYRRRNA